MDEIRTPIGIITGTVRVFGFRMQGLCFQAVVMAECDGVETEATVRLSGRANAAVYHLPVFPGTWRVKTVLGPTTTEHREVTIADGDLVGLDFVFGRAR